MTEIVKSKLTGKSKLSEKVVIANHFHVVAKNINKYMTIFMKLQDQTQAERFTIFTNNYCRNKKDVCTLMQNTCQD